ncbi:MAG: FixH family protein [Chloroflexi bacterium]|nr:FixH family protein [Chloroflexota bacterium]
MKRIIILLLLLLAGCRAQNPTPTAETRLDIEIQVEPVPPAVGEATLLVTVTDAAGQPVNDAKISARGDMSHAGMAPVLAETTGGTDGLYRLPFQWTMGGDWLVEITAARPDGTTTTRQFDLTVQP